MLALLMLVTLSMVQLGTAGPIASYKETPSARYFVFTNKKTWSEARQYCHQIGLDLATILTYEEQLELRQFIRANNYLPRDQNSGYWLGAKAQGNKWTWQEVDKPLAGEYFLAGWHFRQPDYQVKNGQRQQCMELQHVNNTKFDEALSWNDLWCDEKRGFVCQIPDHDNIDF